MFARVRERERERPLTFTHGMYVHDFTWLLI